MTNTTSDDSDGREPSLIGEPTEGVGFLDAPGIDARQLFHRIVEVLAGMPAGSVLSVYTDDPAARAAAAEWCRHRGVELLVLMRHDRRGTTFTLRRPEPPPAHTPRF